MDNPIIIYLDKENADKFVLFQKYYNNINLCLERKVFDQQAAAITLHFDNQGEIVNITRSDLLYLKGKFFINDNEKSLS